MLLLLLLLCFQSINIKKHISSQIIYYILNKFLGFLHVYLLIDFFTCTISLRATYRPQANIAFVTDVYNQTTGANRAHPASPLNTTFMNHRPKMPKTTKGS